MVKVHKIQPDKFEHFLHKFWMWNSKEQLLGKEDWDREVCLYIHDQSVDIKGYTYDSSHQSAEQMLCVVNTAIWM